MLPEDMPPISPPTRAETGPEATVRRYERLLLLAAADLSALLDLNEPLVAEMIASGDFGWPVAFNNSLYVTLDGYGHYRQAADLDLPEPLSLGIALLRWREWASDAPPPAEMLQAA